MKRKRYSQSTSKTFEKLVRLKLQQEKIKSWIATYFKHKGPKVYFGLPYIIKLCEPVGAFPKILLT